MLPKKMLRDQHIIINEQHYIPPRLFQRSIARRREGRGLLANPSNPALAVPMSQLLADFFQMIPRLVYHEDFRAFRDRIDHLFERIDQFMLPHESRDCDCQSVVLRKKSLHS